VGSTRGLSVSYTETSEPDIPDTQWVQHVDFTFGCNVLPYDKVFSLNHLVDEEVNC